MNIDNANLEKNYRMLMEIGSWNEALSKVYDHIKDSKDIMETVKKMSGNLEKEAKEKLLKTISGLEKKLDEFSSKMFTKRDQKGIQDNSKVLIPKIQNLQRLVSNSFMPVTQAAEVKHKKVKAELEKRLQEANELFEKEIEPFKKQIASSASSLFKKFEPVKIGDK